MPCHPCHECTSEQCHPPLAAACDILTHDETPPPSDRRKEEKAIQYPKIPPSPLSLFFPYRISRRLPNSNSLHLKPIPPSILPSPLLTRPREGKQICAQHFFIRLILRPSVVRPGLRKSNRTKRFPSYPPFHPLRPSLPSFSHSVRPSVPCQVRLSQTFLAVRENWPL